MKKIILLILFLPLISVSYAQISFKEAKASGNAELNVLIEDMYPYAYYKGDTLTGIEVDILKRFAEWVNIRKGIDLQLKFKSYSVFNDLYKEIADGKDLIGSASITINKKRKKEVEFTPAYLKNRMVLVTHNSVPTIKSYNELPTSFDDKVALVISGTTFEKEIKDIRAMHYRKLRVKYVENTDELITLLRKDGHYFAVIDLVTFWDYVKNEEEPLKLHRIATGKKEEFGFILPKNCDWSPVLKEFFDAGLGFTASEDYYLILKKHLGKEVLETVAKN